MPKSLIEKYLEENCINEKLTGTKWKSLYEIFITLASDSDSKLFTFIERCIHEHENVWNTLNMHLARDGYIINKSGIVEETEIETNRQTIRTKFDNLTVLLKDIKIHSDVLKYCNNEIIKNDYFHALNECGKSLIHALEEKSCVRFDARWFKGNESNYIDQIFKKVVYLGDPFNQNDIDETKGLKEMIVATRKLIRNPTSHRLSINWNIDKYLACEMFCLFSLILHYIDKLERR